MLQAIGITKTYQQYTALNNLHLEVPRGEVYCLLGQNGAGKTTTLNIFLGFIAADVGEARINGETVKKGDAATRRYLAYIPEVVMLYGNLTSLENLDFFSRIAGFRYGKAQLADFLARAGLQGAAFHKPVGSYSKGMRQKVGIAIAIAKNADVLLMDEPTSGLDPKATNEFTEIVKSLGQSGKSVLMATHDIFNAVNLGTRIGIMKQGQLVHELPAAEITASALQQLYLETI